MFRFVLVLLALVFSHTAFAADAAFERIRKNREINCGVYVLGSIFSYDDAGKPAGFTTDLFTEVGYRSGLAVRYTEISSFATVFEDLKAGRYDMICAPLLLVPSTTMKAMPGAFILEDPINIYADVRADLSGITSLTQLNNSKFSFVGMDGELGGLYVPHLYPKARLNLLPMGAPPSNMFMDVHTKKSDFVVLSLLAANAYEKANPGKLRQVTKQSLLTSSVRLFYPEGSETLRANIDALIDDMRRDGTLDRLLEKHGLIKKNP